MSEIPYEVRVEGVAARLENWARIQAELAERTAGIDAEIRELMERRAQVGERYHKELAKLNSAILVEVYDLGEGVEVEGIARATYKGGYTRYSWPNAALEGYAAAHPEILKLRKETQVKPSIKVELWA